MGAVERARSLSAATVGDAVVGNNVNLAASSDETRSKSSRNELTHAYGMPLLA